MTPAEQEADLQRYVEHLKQRGIIAEDTGNRSPPRYVSLKHSLQSYEVLGEILQQGARLNVPHAALMQEYEKRVKAKLPPLSEEEFRIWRSQLGIGGQLTAAQTTQLHLQPNRYASLRQSVAQPRAKGLSPEAAEAARRQFMVAVRGMVYGSLIAGLIVTSLGSYLCYRYDLKRLHDLKPIMQKWVAPLGASLHTQLAPWKDWAHQWTDNLKVKSSEESSAHLKYDTEFSRALKRKFSNGR